jgi:hypothetical protein
MALEIFLLSFIPAAVAIMIIRAGVINIISSIKLIREV